jgi:hypothetical protein
MFLCLGKLDTHPHPARPGKSTRLGTPGKRLGTQQFLFRHSHPRFRH